MKKIEDEHLKAYHEGYEQGRFDEFADRMGKEQAEKVKGELEQQKNCPYCHKPYKPFVSTGTEPANGLSKSSYYACVGVSNVLGEVPIAEDALGIINVLKVPYCPFCRRPLGKEDNNE